MHLSIESGIRIDPAAATEAIVAAMRGELSTSLKRRGYVVAMSGGVDSSVCAALAARAVGPEHVFGLFLPEHESDPLSLRLATECAEKFGIPHRTEDMSGEVADMK